MNCDFVNTIIKFMSYNSKYRICPDRSQAQVEAGARIEAGFDAYRVSPSTLVLHYNRAQNALFLDRHRCAQPVTGSHVAPTMTHILFWRTAKF